MNSTKPTTNTNDRYKNRFAIYLSDTPLIQREIKQEAKYNDKNDLSFWAYQKFCEGSEVTK